MQSVNIGLSQEQRQGVTNLLNQDLADSYLLIIKTKKYHWDVVGTAKGFLENASLKEHPGDLPTANEMVSRLVSDHE